MLISAGMEVHIPKTPKIRMNYAYDYTHGGGKSAMIPSIGATVLSMMNKRVHGVLVSTDDQNTRERLRIASRSGEIEAFCNCCFSQLFSGYDRVVLKIL